MVPNPPSERKVLPPTYFLIAITVMAGLHFLLPGRQVIVSPFRSLGLVLLGSGLVVNVWASRLFEQAGTTIKPFQRPSILVARGPFRWSRNPMYAGMLIALLGVGVLAGSVTPFLVVPVFGLLIGRIFIRVEEEDLARALGPAYLEYKAKVRRWL